MNIRLAWCFLGIVLCSCQNESRLKVNAEIDQHISALSSPESSKRIESLAKLATFREDAVPALMEALKSANPRVRYSAAGSLALIGTGAQQALPIVVVVMREDKNAPVRQMAQLAANQIGGTTAAPIPEQVSLSADEIEGGMSLAAPGPAMLQGLKNAYQSALSAAQKK